LRRLQSTTFPPELLFVAGGISGYLGAALAVLLFGRIDAAGVTLLRVASAALLLVAWRRPRLPALGSRRWLLLAAFGAALAFMNLTFYLAIARIPVGTAVAIEFAGPVAVAAIGSRRALDWAALAIGVGGVALVAGTHYSHDSTGIALALLAAVCWAAYIVLGHRVAAVIGIGLLSSVVPYALDQLTMRRLPRHRFALTLALLPATAAVIGSVVLGQTPSVEEVLGIVLVMAAILVTQGARQEAPHDGVAPILDPQ
jgi:inner membrane transporter RhtA